MRVLSFVRRLSCSDQASARLAVRLPASCSAVPSSVSRPRISRFALLFSARAGSPRCPARVRDLRSLTNLPTPLHEQVVMLPRRPQPPYVSSGEFTVKLTTNLSALSLSPPVSQNVRLILGPRITNDKIKLVGKLFDTRKDNRDWCLKVLQDVVWEAKEMEGIEFIEESK